MTYDLIIIGGGPAGVSAGVYAARKNLKTLFITEEWGGQSKVSADIQNWIGTPHITGLELADNLKKHLEEYKGEWVEIKEAKGDKVEQIDPPAGGGFKATTDKGESFDSKAVLIAAGGSRRRLEVTGADEFEHKGLTYCASCDGPFFTDKDVVVLGGGNAGFETAAQLLAYCKSVTLLNRKPDVKADKITVNAVLQNPKMKLIVNADTTEVKGDTTVKAIVYKNLETGEVIELPTEGIFIEIGFVPNTQMVEGLVEFNPIKQINVDCKNQRTSVEGIWAAGDCTNGLYHQNNIASGDAVKALEDIYLWLKAK